MFSVTPAAKARLWAAWARVLSRKSKRAKRKRLLEWLAELEADEQTLRVVRLHGPDTGSSEHAEAVAALNMGREIAKAFGVEA